AAIPGEAATGGGGRHADILGELAHQGAEGAVEPQVAPGAGRVDGHGSQLVAHLEPREEALERPGDRVDDLEPDMALALLLAECAADLGGDPMGARARVDNHRQLPLARP